MFMLTRRTSSLSRVLPTFPLLLFMIKKVFVCFHRRYTGDTPFGVIIKSTTVVFQNFQVSRVCIYDHEPRAPQKTHMSVGVMND
jgi:hypothetical protein